MKSFFKKLAFVMALAMVVSLAAQSAFAATEFTYAEQKDGKWAGTGKVSSLAMKAGDKVDLGFIGVKDYKNYTLKWESSNEAVATVDKNGVITAVADGVAKVELKVGDGADYTSSPVVVTVGEVMNVTLGTPENKAMIEYDLKVDEKIDLNFYGFKGWDSSKYACQWVQDDTSVVSIDAKGEVTALKAGATATVYAVFTDKKTGDVLTNVKVIPVVITILEKEASDEFTVIQKTDSTVTLTFANKKLTKEEVNAEAIKVNYYANDTAVDFPVKSVSEIKDGVATVEFFISMSDGVTYEVTYKEESQKFLATVGEVSRINFTWRTGKRDGVAYVNEDVTLDAKMYNAAGVDITAAVLASGGSIRFEFLNMEKEDSGYWGYDNIIQFTEARKVVQVRATYITGLYNDDGTEKASNVGPAIKTIVSTEAPQYTMETGILDHTIAVSGKADWKNTNKKFSLSDTGNYQLYIKAKDINGDEKTSPVAGTDGGNWIFQSSNENKLAVGSNGELMPNEAGTVSVLVYYQPVQTGEQPVPKKFVGAVAVTVSPERAPASIQVTDGKTLSLSTEEGSNNYNKGTVTLEVKDGLGAVYGGADVEISYVGKATNSPEIAFSGKTGADGKLKLTVTANSAFDDGVNATVQSYTFNAKCNNKVTSFTVSVRKPDADKISARVIEFTGDNDINAKNGATFVAHLVQQSNGVSFEYEKLKGQMPSKVSEMIVGKYYYTVTKNNKTLETELDDAATGVVVALTGKATASAVTASSSALVSLDYIDKTDSAGDYVVNFYKATGEKDGDNAKGYVRVGTSKTWTVKDSRPDLTYVSKASNSFSNKDALKDDALVRAMVTGCLKFKLGNMELKPNDQKNWKITIKNENLETSKEIALSVEYNKANNSNSVYIKSVTFYVPLTTKTEDGTVVFNGLYEKYTVKVGTTISSDK